MHVLQFNKPTLSTQTRIKRPKPKPDKKRTKTKARTTMKSPMWLSIFKSLRRTTIVLGVLNIGVVVVGIFLLVIDVPNCDCDLVVKPILFVLVLSVLKIITMIKTGFVQRDTAKFVVDFISVDDSAFRLQRKVWYKKWVRWSRFLMLINMLQTVAAIYLLFRMTKHMSRVGKSSQCALGSTDSNWNQKVHVLFTIVSFIAPFFHCFAGAPVLRWRAFYLTQDDAWRAHYQEVFDHGIREALCCLGRVRYMSVSKEDEVYTAARLLGDLVAYRASGTGHLELLAGLALLQRQSESPKLPEEFVDALKEQIEQALAYHKFAEAAYTGPLLDFGRYVFLFPCVWFYRQGILSPWMRNRRPRLTGDNWWRGHAAAFLKFVDLPPEALRRGRVCQERCEAAYCIVVLHNQRTVVIAVRGTETPEDLITDALGRECLLSRDDLDGLVNSSHINPEIKHRVESSFPHFGHAGVVETARELYMQVEGIPVNNELESGGFLSSLLGPGCECDGYDVRIVGHSLGGAIAAMLGLRLYRHYPSLHVYSYGPLPCVDSVVAEACSNFITSIIHNNEFSSRLSVGSIIRLRAAAIKSLSQDSTTDSALIFRLARRFIYMSRFQKGVVVAKDPPQLQTNATLEDQNCNTCGSDKQHNSSHWSKSDITEMINSTDDDECAENPFYDRTAIGYSSEDPEYQFLGTAPRPENESTVGAFEDSPVNTLDPVSQFLESIPSTGNSTPEDPPELFLPGQLIHIVPQQKNADEPSRKFWGFQERIESYKAYLAKKEDFKEIIVSPDMFFDHLPWRCHTAMRKVLEARNAQEQLMVSQMV